MDNLENYQRAYGRMPGRSSSAGPGGSTNKVYVSAHQFNHHHHQHHHGMMASPTSSTSTTSFSHGAFNSSGGRARYESLSTVNKGRLVYTSSGLEDEDGYAACSHPSVPTHGLLQLNSGCSLTNLSSGDVSPSFSPSPAEQMMHYTTSFVVIPPPAPSPPVPTSKFKHVKAFRVAAASATDPTIDTTSSGELEDDDEDEEEDEEALLIRRDAGGGGGGGGGMTTPGDDEHLNLDHLVQIVRSFQQEQEMHQSGLAVATFPSEDVVTHSSGASSSSPGSSSLTSPPPLPPPPPSFLTPLPPLLSTDVLVIEEEDEDDLSATSPESNNGMGTIKRRPSPVAATTEQQQRNRQTSIIERDESSGCDEGQVIAALASAAARDALDSSSSSCGSPTATTTASVAFHNNNNNNNNNSVNNNKKTTVGSPLVGGATAVRPCSDPSTFSEVPPRLIKPPIAPRPPRLAAASAGPSGITVATAKPSEFGNQLTGAGSTNCLSLYPLPDGDASDALLRLHAVDPYTVSFNVKDVMGPLVRTNRSDSNRPVTVQEVIDQLEQQVDATRCQVRGVRMLCVPATAATVATTASSSFVPLASPSLSGDGTGGSTLFFISVDSARSLHYLTRHPFRLRGQRVRLTDVSAQTWIVSLSGVPHYISDATVSLLLAAFGTIVGDVERRFYRGTDTGERLVRFRLKGLAKLPRHITVGGCRIQVRRVSPAPPTYATAASSMLEDSGSVRSSVRGTHRRFKPSVDDDDSLPNIVDLDSPSSSMQQCNASGTAAATGTISKTTVMAAVAAVGSTSSSAGSVTDCNKKATPKIGRSFEYRSQLRVDLRMSTELPAPVLIDDDAASRTTPSSCPVCEQQQQIPHPLSAMANKRLPSSTPPPLPPAMVIHRCRKHDTAIVSANASASGTPVGPGQPPPLIQASNATTTTSTTTTTSGVVHRESPPKSRASVNFDETAATSSGGGGSGAGGRVPASGISAGTGPRGLANTKGTASSSSSNGILRKSVSGDEGSVAVAAGGGASSSSGAGTAGAATGSSTTEGSNDAAAGNFPGGGIDGSNNNSNAVGGKGKKTARSFSLVDTFRSASSRERRANAKTDKVVRVETVIENASPSNAEDGGAAVRTVVVRRDSIESSSRSSRSSRKSNELPWCGCWGNGCL